MNFRFRMLGLAVSCCSIIAAAQTNATASALSSLPAVNQVAEFRLPATVRGNFDHLAVDLQRQRLFLAAEDTQAVLVLSLSNGDLLTSIPVQRPHAILYRADLDRLYVTDGLDGSLRIFEGLNYQPSTRIGLEKDADSIGFDLSRKLLYVANGGGDAGQKFSFLSVVDTDRAEKLRDMRINGDTLEAMALDAYRPRLYLNDRSTSEIVVIDRFRNVEVGRWPLHDCRANVAMALDEQRQRLFVGCRDGQIAVLDTNTGQQLQTLTIHNGVDDLNYDPVVRRLYASGDGFLDIIDQIDLNHYQSRGSEPTGAMARTSHFVPELNRLFVAVPKRGTSPARILVFEPVNTLPPRTRPADVKEPVNAPAAEQLVLSELSRHPTLRRMGLHVIPPGEQTMVLIANGNEARLGIHTSQSDFDAVRHDAIYGPRIEDGEFFNMKMPMFDAQHRRIGILVMEIPCTDAASEQDAAQKASQIRAELAARIPDLQSLFGPVSH